MNISDVELSVEVIIRDDYDKFTSEEITNISSLLQSQDVNNLKLVEALLEGKECNTIGIQGVIILVEGNPSPSLIKSFDVHQHTSIYNTAWTLDVNISIEQVKLNYWKTWSMFLKFFEEKEYEFYGAIESGYDFEDYDFHGSPCTYGIYLEKQIVRTA